MIILSAVFHDDNKAKSKMKLGHSYLFFPGRFELKAITIDGLFVLPVLDKGNH